MNRRGVVDPVTMTLVALVALSVGVFGTSWKPLEVFRPKPPTAELTKLQAQLEETKAAAAAAEKAHQEALATERRKLEQEIRGAQEDNVGVVTALAKVPVEKKTPETNLAYSMAGRVAVKLAAAIGDLPKDQRAAMIALIDQALSEKQSEVDAAMRKLAVRDAAFAALEKETNAVRAQIPVLAEQAKKAEQRVAETESKVTAKTEEVKQVADKLDAKVREAGSLGASLNKVLYVVAALAAGYFFLTIILPGLVKHMDSGPIKNGLRNVSGYLTNPLLFHDARKKLNDLSRDA
jgi:predicted  nucleic acid-binding Zn-ribbon protein